MSGVLVWVYFFDQVSLGAILYCSFCCCFLLIITVLLQLEGFGLF